MKSLTDYLDLSPPEKPMPNIKVYDDFMPRVFAYIESITFTKKYLMDTPEEEVLYNRSRWMIHKGLSQYPDIIPILNIVNSKPDLSAKMDYEILLYTVPARQRRGGKWSKRSPNSVYMDTIREYYGYTEAKAEEAMKLLSVEDMMSIEEKIRKKGDTWTFSEDMESR